MMDTMNNTSFSAANDPSALSASLNSPSSTEQREPDLLIDFEDVSFIRDGKFLLKDITWKVELDERTQ